MAFKGTILKMYLIGVLQDESLMFKLQVKNDSIHKYLITSFFN